MNKINIGITGQSGFIGTNLYNTLCLYPDRYNCIPFDDSVFSINSKLEEWVYSCDVIIHLAALNRHNDPDVIYTTNIGLVNKIISALETTKSAPHILFSSSYQEEKQCSYGKSKKEGRTLLENWANKNNANFTGLIIPNVYGPFGNPFYNSVIATFCYQLTHNEIPKVDLDVNLKLIYIGELVGYIIDRIEFINNLNNNDKIIETIKLTPSSQFKVSSILNILESFKRNYLERGEIPSLVDSFHRNLFFTFLCYINHRSFFPYKLKKHSDNRGSFIETLRLNSGGQISFSTTKPGVTRGNHFHSNKIERFIVIKGSALVEFRRIGSNELISFELNGEDPSFIDMPIWYVHNIKNIGDEELYTLFWINEFYNTENPDTFSEIV